MGGWTAHASGRLAPRKLPHGGPLQSRVVNLLSETVVLSLGVPLRVLVTLFAGAWVGCLVLILAHTVLPGWKHDAAPDLVAVIRASGFCVLAVTLPLNIFLDTRVQAPVGIVDLLTVLAVMLPWFVVAGLVERWQPREVTFVGAVRTTPRYATWPFARLKVRPGGIALQPSVAIGSQGIWELPWADIARVERTVRGVRLIVRGREADPIVFFGPFDRNALLLLLERHGVRVDGV